MLLLTRERFHMNFIQFYLQGGQSNFQDGPHQLIVLSSKKPVHVGWTGILSSSQLQRDREKATAKVAVKGIRTS